MRRPRSPYLKLARLIEDEGFEQEQIGEYFFPKVEKGA